MIQLEDCIIVSLGIGWEYPLLLERMVLSCYDYHVKVKAWKEYPKGSPTHNQSPYGFKYHAIREALNEGVKIVIWFDCSVYIVQDPMPFFKVIEEKGIVFLGPAGWLDSYADDKSLKEFGVCREEAKHIQLVSGSLFGFDFRQKKAIEFFEMIEKYEREKWFCCDNQEPGSVFKTHRHDEAIIGLLLYKYNIEVLNAWKYFQGDESTVMFKANKDIK